MALLNPPELRPSLVVLVTTYLAGRRGGRDKSEHVLRCLAPESLTPDGKHTVDLLRNIGAAVELGLITRDGDYLEATRETVAASKSGTAGLVAHIRRRVLSPEMNTAPWGSQVGARDLTNGLAWFLGLPETKAPNGMESGSVTVKALQETDFGPRIAAPRGTDSDDDDNSGWPIANSTRWGPFQRWSCSLGFAWIDPIGRLIPDPTPALRDALPQVLKTAEVQADAFLAQLASSLPVLDRGEYRAFVEMNLRGKPEHSDRISQSLSHALRRLQREKAIALDDRADATRVTLFDGTTISHVRKAKP
jgi:hypothetical protein